MNPWIMVIGWAIGMLLASRWVANWLPLVEDWGQDSATDALGTLFVFMVCLFWPIILFGVAIYHAGRILVRTLTPSLGTWIEAFYTLDREQRKGLFRDR